MQQERKTDGPHQNVYIYIYLYSYSYIHTYSYYIYVCVLRVGCLCMCGMFVPLQSFTCLYTVCVCAFVPLQLDKIGAFSKHLGPCQASCARPKSTPGPRPKDGFVCRWYAPLMAILMGQIMIVFSVKTKLVRKNGWKNDGAGSCQFCWSYIPKASPIGLLVLRIAGSTTDHIVLIKLPVSSYPWFCWLYPDHISANYIPTISRLHPCWTSIIEQELLYMCWFQSHSMGFVTWPHFMGWNDYATVFVYYISICIYIYISTVSSDINCNTYNDIYIYILFIYIYNYLYIYISI